MTEEAEIGFVSLTGEDLANINAALQIALPHASRPSEIRKLQKKVCLLRRVTPPSEKGAV